MKQLFYGGVPVPYTVSWSSEASFFVDTCIHARREAIVQNSDRGNGKPVFSKPHMNRQRETIAKCLCDLCGKSIRNSTKVSLSMARPQPHAKNFGDILQVEPLLHRKCAATCVEHCPALKRQISDGMLNIRQVFSHGVQFAILGDQGVFEVTGVRQKAIGHAKVHLKKWADRDFEWLVK